MQRVIRLCLAHNGSTAQLHHELLTNRRLKIPLLGTSCRTHFLDARDKDMDKKNQLLTQAQDEIFEQLGQKARDKKTYQKAVNMYLDKQRVYRRGHVEFLYAALQRMKDFNVHRDLDTYKVLLELFPKHKMAPRSMWEVEFMRYPKQQQCCIDILNQMEYNGVIPDDAMGYQLRDIFGDRSHAFRKYQRMMYWLPKFKYANPYYVPHQLPDDRIELAKMALQRMSVDIHNKVTVYDSTELEDASDHTFIASAQSPTQQELLQEHPVNSPVFVEGGFLTWLRFVSMTYFILRSDTTPRFTRYQEAMEEPEDDEHMFDWKMFEEEGRIHPVPIPTDHEQADGTILGMCITGTSSKDSLASWIRFLEKSNSRLSGIPVVFSLHSPEGELQTVPNEEDVDREQKYAQNVTSS